MRGPYRLARHRDDTFDRHRAARNRCRRGALRRQSRRFLAARWHKPPRDRARQRRRGRARCRTARPALRAGGRRRAGHSARPRRRQAAAEATARRRNLHVMRSPSARGQPLRLRTMPQGQARTRPLALCRAKGRQSLRALLAAHGRRPVALQRVPPAGEGTRLPRAGERRQQETICRPPRQRYLRGLQGACRWRRPLSALRMSFQLSRPSDTWRRSSRRRSP